MAKVAPAPKKLFLVDAMGFIFRAYFAPMARLNSPSGLPTKVPYLFSNMLRKLQKEHAPDYLAVVFDTREPTFRDKLFDKYKAQRPPMPDELAIQLPYARRMCEAMRLPILEYPGFEADDVIGALAKQAEKKGLDVSIVTSDKDMMQLVGGNVRVLRPGGAPDKSDLIVDAAKVEEIMGVPPAKVADVMALMGDSIDNIPGAKGIGEKGAKELILRFGSAEAALDRAKEVEGKRYREALENSREAVKMSKQLAVIDTAAPVKLVLDDLEASAPDTEALRAIYTELGFTSLLRDLPAAVPVAAASSDSAALETPAALSRFLASIPKKDDVAVWLNLAEGEREEEGFGSEVAAVEISPRPGVSRTAQLDANGEMQAALAEFLRDPARPKIVHDPKLFELLAGPTSGIRHATILYSYLLRPTTAKHDLADVVLRQENVALSGAPGQRAEHLQSIAPLLRKEVEAQDLTKVYETIDLPLAPVLAAMERDGVLVDRKALDAMSQTMESEIRSLEKTIWKLAESEFNINSPQQLAEILFDKMGLTLGGRRRGKPRSTAADVLEELALLHEMPRKVLEYRELSKLKSTYVDALPKLIHGGTGRLHTSFSQTTAATGRLSSSNPNLQNIPVRSELGREIRAAFVAGPGNTLLSADYSQIELRILADFSKDPVLVEAFRSGQDIHARTAEEVFGVGPMAQNAEHRRAAKAINFGIIYGQTPFGLAAQLGIDQKEAAQFIAAYFARYRGVKEYLERSLAEARKAGATRTLFGRMRPIAEITSPQVNLRNFAERTALNTPLQGTAADLIKLAMITIARELAEQQFQARMILQVHDELLFEAPHDEVDRLRKLVRNAMENVHKLAVPLVVDLKAGPNWRDMK
ncbi:MAG TPA: DNA polymerase I [Candidatus Sulfotelmatobacter sp.]|jgi:DNA polymerase-1|nr:DNA polymerase I [Candidatus Sulfotelmatobacter sp.]